LIIQNKQSLRLYQKISFPVFYYIPLIVLFSSSVLLAKKLISTNETSRTSPVWRRNQRAVTQLSLVVVSYLIGYLPHIVYFQYTSHNVSDPAKQRTDYWISMAVYICLRLSECMNPFLYNMASTKMRRASMRAIGKILSCICRYDLNLNQEVNSETNRTERSITTCTTTGGTTSLSRQLNSRNNRALHFPTAQQRQCQSDPSIFSSLMASDRPHNTLLSLNPSADARGGRQGSSTDRKNSELSQDHCQMSSSTSSDDSLNDGWVKHPLRSNPEPSRVSFPLRSSKF